ncbi:MAG: hypothetical protein ACXVCX_06475, partial [Ktedonobacterales bacterium]
GTYAAAGNRLSKTITSGTTTTAVNNAYQTGQLVSESDGSGTLLATFTYDVNGVPSSVQVGSDLTTAPRYYYSYNGHGDVVALTDAGGSTVATYSYDTFGTPTIWESFTNGWAYYVCFLLRG